MTNLVPITVAKGDGIGPEIMDATLRILEAAGARIKPEFVEIGEKAYLSGIPTGITEEAFDSIRRNKIILKSPLTTPQGAGFKSVNVTLRKTLGLYANVRPVQTYEPYVHTRHSDVDMVIVRENEEDLYAGIEYRQTKDTCQSVKLISRSGSERLIRFAFEYARANGRKKVSCLIKDNIMKISDGLFHKVFKLIAQEYPEIESDSHIVDIGMARVAATPEEFDVVVTLNLYGDIVSDIASQVAGSVGLAGSFNIGEEYAMFEAVHGSAPDIAGKGIANPSGLLNGAILMLHHIGQSDVAVNIHNAWLRAIEDGQHTGDVAADKSKAMSTAEFADAVIARLGQKPVKFPEVTVEGFEKIKVPTHAQRTVSVRQKTEIGVDIFVDEDKRSAQEIGDLISANVVEGLHFELLSSRGAKVYPGKSDAEIVTDLWCCRFYGAQKEGPVSKKMITAQLAKFEEIGLDWVKLETLCKFDDERCFALSQGE